MKRFKAHLWNSELNRPLLYQPIEHPDYAGWEVMQPCVERLGMMQLTPAGRMVDIGCHTGWFCRQFARAGWQTTGIDKSAIHIEIAVALNEWAKLDSAFVCGDVGKIDIPECDVALCLSVAMYIGWPELDKISRAAARMYMDFGGMYSDRLPFDESNVIERMKANTQYAHGELIGRTAMQSRPFYLFTK